MVDFRLPDASSYNLGSPIIKPVPDVKFQPVKPIPPIQETNLVMDTVISGLSGILGEMSVQYKERARAEAIEAKKRREEERQRMAALQKEKNKFRIEEAELGGVSPGAQLREQLPTSEITSLADVQRRKEIDAWNTGVRKSQGSAEGIQAEVMLHEAKLDLEQTYAGDPDKFANEARNIFKETVMNNAMIPREKKQDLYESYFKDILDSRAKMLGDIEDKRQLAVNETMEQQREGLADELSTAYRLGKTPDRNLMEQYSAIANKQIEHVMKNGTATELGKMIDYNEDQRRRFMIDQMVVQLQNTPRDKAEQLWLSGKLGYINPRTGEKTSLKEWSSDDMIGALDDIYGVYKKRDDGLKDQYKRNKENFEEGSLSSAALGVGDPEIFSESFANSIRTMSPQDQQVVNTPDFLGSVRNFHRLKHNALNNNDFNSFKESIKLVDNKLAEINAAAAVELDPIRKNVLLEQRAHYEKIKKTNDAHWKSVLSDPMTEYPKLQRAASVPEEKIAQSPEDISRATGIKVSLLAPPKELIDSVNNLFELKQFDEARSIIVGEGNQWGPKWMKNNVLPNLSSEIPIYAHDFLTSPNASLSGVMKIEVSRRQGKDFIANNPQIYNESYKPVLQKVTAGIDMLAGASMYEGAGKHLREYMMGRLASLGEVDEDTVKEIYKEAIPLIFAGKTLVDVTGEKNVKSMLITDIPGVSPESVDRALTDIEKNPYAHNLSGFDREEYTLKQIGENVNLYDKEGKPLVDDSLGGELPTGIAGDFVDVNSVINKKESVYTLDELAGTDTPDMINLTVSNLVRSNGFLQKMVPDDMKNGIYLSTTKYLEDRGTTDEYISQLERVLPDSKIISSSLIRGNRSYTPGFKTDYAEGDIYDTGERPEGKRPKGYNLKKGGEALRKHIMENISYQHVMDSTGYVPDPLQVFLSTTRAINNILAGQDVQAGEDIKYLNIKVDDVDYFAIRETYKE